MESKDKHGIVPSSSLRLVRHPSDLVRRGLQGLAKVRCGRGRILVVNDREDPLRAVGQILVANGYQVGCARLAGEGLAVAKLFEPEVVMLGINMPVTLGRDLFASPFSPKIILWGEVGEAEDLDLRRDLYEFDVLLAPANPAELLGLIATRMAEVRTDDGLRLAAEGHHLEALQLYENALSIDAHCVQALLNKGHSLDELGKLSEAVETYDKAIEIAPSHWVPWVRKGDLLDRSGQFEAAILCFDSALAITPDISSGWMGKGMALHDLGRYEEALLCYDKVLEIDRTTWTPYGRACVYSPAWNSKGASLYRMHRYTESIECCDKAIALDPEFPFPWYNKGNCYRETNNFNEAILCYEKAIELFPEHGASWNNKGICLRELGRLEEALECYERALISDSAEMRAWYNKAMVQEDLGRVPDAISSYEKYLAVAPPTADQQVKYALERLENLKSKGEPGVT